ncbi:MAG: aminotransferase class V-fold PLP-dependent enzyme [Gammaproteobacteria bacterium]|nr:aminotransferase class V-fold PLP-dependent enzyme [Gammaproteobacteria bacterium]
MASVSLEEEFPQTDEIIYLNHAGVSPWPRRAVLAVEAFARENLEQGSLNYAQWIAEETRLREQLACLINAPSSDDIALLKNTSEGLSFIAGGMEWQRGENVVSSDQEFSSNRIVWQALARYGVEFRQVPIQGLDAPEAAIMAACDAHTGLLTVSSVQYGSGIRLDLGELGTFCRENGILFCVDAIQSLAAVRLDVQAIDADFVVADGHKWMMGPEGLALFYCRKALRERLKLMEYGWHMTEHYLEYDRQDWQVSATARRFECGSPNLLGAHALSASLSLIHEIGMEEIERSVIKNSSYIFDFIESESNFSVRTPNEPGRYAGIVSFRPTRADVEALYHRLSKSGVVCALRQGAIRFSPHFYTPRAKLDRALACLNSR